MNSALRAELLKLRTTRTTLGLAAALLGTTGLAAAVHLLGFDGPLVDQRAEQLGIILDIGVSIGLLFAAVAGMLAITGEFRHGTIRSTLVRQPRRSRLLTAKVVSQAVVGASLGALGSAYAVALAALLLGGRGIDFQLDSSDVATLVAGSALGGALFAQLGLAIATMVRSQVPVVTGALIWMLFLESLLRAGMPDVGKFAPGSLARAIAGQSDAALSSTPGALAVLAGLCVVALVAANLTFQRRDLP